MPVDFLAISGWTIGAVVFCIGLWVLGGRADLDTARTLRRLSKASRAVVGLSLMIAGYHVAAYVSPSGWLPLRVPLERAWIMGLVMVVGVGLSLVMDRRDRDRSGESGTGDGGGGRARDE